MVTIEEKIKLFYKLLNQSMDQSFTDELKDLKEKYESKIQKAKNEIDKEAKDIEERAAKRADIKRAESISKSKVIIKKDIMVLKEKYYYTFMEKFNKNLDEFIKSDDYKLYLSKIISKLVAEIKDYGKCNIIIYLTKNDQGKYSDFIKDEIAKKLDCNVSFSIEHDIKGGFICVIEDRGMKIDLSIDSVLDENKDYIMQTIFETLEAGDYNG